jgi:biotin transport system substrate-specific component
MKTKDLTLTALFAALLCISAPWALPVGAVPLTLATFSVYLAAGALGWKRGLLAVLVYLLLGTAGLPVFSGFMGGAQKLAGVTGGFLVGYLPCALFAGLLPDRFPGRRWPYPTGMILGTAALYALGTAWFMFQTHSPAAAALLTCVVPFLPGDAVKIAAASLLAPVLRKYLRRYGS